MPKPRAYIGYSVYRNVKDNFAFGISWVYGNGWINFGFDIYKWQHRITFDINNRKRSDKVFYGMHNS